MSDDLSFINSPLNLHDTIAQTATNACNAFLKVANFKHATAQIAVECDGRKMLVEMTMTVTEHAEWPEPQPQDTSEPQDSGVRAGDDTTTSGAIGQP